MSAKIHSLNKPSRKVSRTPATFTVGTAPDGEQRISFLAPPTLPLRLVLPGGITLEHTHPKVLGMAAAIAGVRIVDAKASTLSQGTVRLYAAHNRAKLPPIHESSYELGYWERQSLDAFQYGLEHGTDASRLSNWEFDRLLEDWPAALGLVPLEMRVIERPVPGVFNEKGDALTKAEMARRAEGGGFNAKTFIEESLKALERGPVSAEGVTLYSDAANEEPDAPVVFSGQSELEMRRIIEDLGLDRMPFTVAEYAGVVEYFDWFNQATGKYLSLYEKLCKKNPQFIRELHKSNVESAEQFFPHWAEPLALFLSEKHAELKAHHQKFQFVEYLGRWWTWSIKHDDNKAAGRPTEEAPSPLQVTH